MEKGDIFVVNKADRDGADRVVRELRAMLETQPSCAAARRPWAGQTRWPRAIQIHAPRGTGADRARCADQPWRPGSPLPPVLKTMLETGVGVPEPRCHCPSF
jgi:LAO/AO transport system kinase